MVARAHHIEHLLNDRCVVFVYMKAFVFIQFITITDSTTNELPSFFGRLLSSIHPVFSIIHFLFSENSKHSKRYIRHLVYLPIR